jgi:hypothetical protein
MNSSVRTSNQFSWLWPWQVCAWNRLYHLEQLMIAVPFIAKDGYNRPIYASVSPISVISKWSSSQTRPAVYVPRMLRFASHYADVQEWSALSSGPRLNGKHTFLPACVTPVSPFWCGGFCQELNTSRPNPSPCRILWNLELRAFRLPVWFKNFLLHVVQTGSVPHPVSFPMLTGGFFPRE